MNNDTPQLRLQYASESISSALAAGLDSVSGFGSRLADVLPNIISGFKELVSTGKPVEDLRLTSDQRTFLRLLDQHMYSELRYINVFVPEGFNGKYIDLVNQLDQQVAYCLTVSERVLAPYVMFLAKFSNGGDAIKSLNTDEIKNHKFKAARKQLEEQYAAMFVDGAKARAPYGQVVDRNADWEQVFKVANSLESSVRGLDRKQINIQCRQAETYLELVERKLRAGVLVSATPEVCKALADGAEQVANEVAYVATVYFRVLALFGSLDNSVTEVRRVIRA